MKTENENNIGLYDYINAVVENLKIMKNKLNEQNININFYLYLKCSVYDDEITSYDTYQIEYDSNYFNFESKMDEIKFFNHLYDECVLETKSLFADVYFQKIYTFNQENMLFLTKI